MLSVLTRFARICDRRISAAEQFAEFLPQSGIAGDAEALARHIEQQTAIALAETQRGQTSQSSYENIRDWNREARTFEAIAGSFSMIAAASFGRVSEPVVKPSMV